MTATLSHRALVESLAAHFVSRQRPPLIFTEVALEGSYGSHGRLDVATLTIGRNYTHSPLWGYEVKATRADLLHDLADRKWERYLGPLHRLHFAFPVGLASLEEIPAPCGVLQLGANGAAGSHSAGIGEPGDPAPTLDTTHSAAIAFHQIQDPISSENLAPALGAKSSGMGVYRKAQRAHHPDDGESWVEDNLANTLDAVGHGPRTAQAILEEEGVRRLTPLECERLQGFPDGWTAGHPDSPRYRMLGNAVPVPVVEWIARRIVACEAHALIDPQASEVPA